MLRFQLEAAGLLLHPLHLGEQLGADGGRLLTAGGVALDTTAEIWSMPSVTWAMDSASLSTALTMAPMAVLDCTTSSSVLFRVMETSSTIRLPRLVA